MPKIDYSDKQIKLLIEGIENGTITATKLPIGYYEAITEYLSRGVMEGWGALETDVVDNLFLQELITNVHMFGAAKTYAMVEDINSLLVDDKGELRTSREFNVVAKETYDNWNDNWGRSEYNTAVAQSEAAAKWQRMEGQKDVLPMLRYSAIGDACAICAPLDGITAHMDAEIWDSIAPTNHFNCKCTLIQEGEETNSTYNNDEVVNDVISKMEEKGQQIFINNVGKTAEIFTKEHEYFKSAPSELGNKNFGLPLPKFT